MSFIVNDIGELYSATVVWQPARKIKHATIVKIFNGISIYHNALLTDNNILG
jgi:hypothetical protein